MDTLLLWKQLGQIVNYSGYEKYLENITHLLLMMNKPFYRLLNNNNNTM